MKKSIFLILILFSCTFNFKVQAQKNVQARIDSLENVLKTSQKDTNKVNVLLNLCSAYQQTDPTKVNFHLKDAAELAKELKISKGIHECFYTQGLTK